MTWSSLGRGECHLPSLLHTRHIYVSAGRAAIAIALEHAGIGEGDEVLVPAYHCESMIAPVEHVRATPVYYRMQPDTHVDIRDLESKVSTNTKAILATHYFGFPQLMLELRTLCDQLGLLLIEDCAHAFFGSAGGRALGTFGDYAVGSAMKFFPVFDGGLLVSSSRDLSNVDLFNPPLTLELKALVSSVEYAMRYGRIRLLSFPLKVGIALKDLIWHAAKRAMGEKLNKSLAPASSEGGYALETQWIMARMSRVSRFLLKKTDVQRICDGRRHNYLKIIDALAGAPGITPLFPELPAGTVPLVVPMIVQHPFEVFPKLKFAGVPIWRFGEYLYPGITTEVCENTIFLSDHVFQFPCHPELTDDEIHWMVDTIKQHVRE